MEDFIELCRDMGIDDESIKNFLDSLDPKRLKGIIKIMSALNEEITQLQYIIFSTFIEENVKASDEDIEFVDTFIKQLIEVRESLKETQKKGA